MSEIRYYKGKRPCIILIKSKLKRGYTVLIYYLDKFGFEITGIRNCWRNKK